MDFQRFYIVLKRYVWVLLLVPVLAASLTYFLVQDLPKEYSSQALISTGLVDQSQRIVVGNTPMDYFATQQQFENIIEFLKMKKNINLLSYKLMLHDLENPDDSFNKIDEEIAALSSVDRQSIISEYKRFLAEGKIITPEDNQKYKLFDYLQSMKYGEAAITEQLEVTRKDNSDFIQINYLSNNPYLSVYVVNTVANDFVHSYQERSNLNQNNSKELLDSLVKGKEESMNVKNNQIKDFQVKNSVINLASQAEALYSQITAKDAQRAGSVGEIQSLQGAIQGIESKLKNGNSELAFTSTVENNQIVTLKNQLQKANERYVDNNFQQEDARAIDSLQSRLSKLVAGSTTSTASDPRILRQNLIQQKLSMEVDLDRAKSGLTVILSDLAQLRARYNSMVPNDAGLKNYEREADVATKEYLSALDMYNQSNAVGSTGIQPRLVQAGVVNPAEPSKQFMYVGLAGMGSFATYILALAIAFLLDRKVRTSVELAVITNKRILGQINDIVPNDKDLKTVWEEGKSTKDYSLYKDLVRSLRFEIDTSMKADNNKIVGVTGIHDNSGASFIASSLAYSFAMIKKRVLLIGGDYVLSKSKELKGKEVDDVTENQFFDSYIIKRELHTDQFITKLTTNSKNESLLEVYNEDVLRNGFEELKKEFDVIIIDMQSLRKVHNTKEWLMFVDKSVAVFPSGAIMEPHDKESISFMNRQNGFLGWILNKTKTQDLGLVKAISSN